MAASVAETIPVEVQLLGIVETRAVVPDVPQAVDVGDREDGDGRSIGAGGAAFELQREYDLATSFMAFRPRLGSTTPT